MQEDTRKMFLSAAKWSIVAIVAAIAFYNASPKYFFTNQGRIKCNRITGEVQEVMGQDKKTGAYVFGKTLAKEKPKKIKRKAEEPDFYAFFKDLPSEEYSGDDSRDDFNDQTFEYQGRT